MEVINPNFCEDPVAFAQPEVTPAANMPLQGINFLLNVIGVHNPAEHEHLIEAGLVDY